MMELDMHSFQKESKLKEVEIKSSLNDCSQYQSVNFELQLQNKQLRKELDLFESQKETTEQVKKDLLLKFNQFGEHQKEQFQQSLAEQKERHKQKRKQMAAKILEQKQAILELKGIYEGKIGQLQEVLG